MICVYCSSETKVTNSRSSTKHSSTWRRRRCSGCSAIFSTREMPILSESLRVKYSSGTLKAFERDILLFSVFDSLSHRKEPIHDSGALTDTIIHKIVALQTGGIIISREIAETTLSVLENFDSAAATYYLAHHKF